MNIKPRIIFALITLIGFALACANPLGGTPQSPVNVETIVAATFSALTLPAPAQVTVQVEIPPADLIPATGLLPRSIYFLNNDAAGLAQVYRLDRDGKTVTQITFEPIKVDGYDVSQVDGSVAYVTNNQMFTINANGGNRSLIVDGGALDENNPFTTSVSNPVWSPNGQTIAFAYNGLNFYSIASGQYNNVLSNLIENQNGFEFPRELYRPEKYTADGSKLMITLGYYEGSSSAIYYPNGNALVRLVGGEGALICCGNVNWTADGSAFYAGYASIGMFSPGLWRVDSASGVVTTLINADAGNGTLNFADAPYLARDGQLYYFFANQPNTGEFANRPPLQLTRSALDGVTNRTIINPDIFNTLNEALWAPDASFVITVSGPIAEVYQGGIVELYYTDGQPPISLLPFAFELKWGQ